MATNAAEEFRQAIERAGLTPPASIIGNGGIQRFASNGDPNDDAGWYVLFLDGLPAGKFGDFRTGITQTWSAKSNATLTAAERKALQRRMAEAQRLRKEAEQQRQQQAQEQAQRIWDSAPPAPADHPYLQNKQVEPYGLRLDEDNRLIVPLFIKNRLVSLQFIPPDGQDKRYLFGGEKKGGSYVLGELTDASTILVAEGFATAASLNEATNLPVVIAFDAPNVLPVAHAYRKQFPSAVIVLCADNDVRSDETPNTGVEAATKAAQAINGLVVVPELDGQKVDFNDLAVQRGREAVRQVIQEAVNQQAGILDEIYTFLGRFIIYPSDEARVAHVLWIAHTHLMEMWESTPRIAFLSPEPASGKTRALEVTETLVPRPVQAVNVSPAYLFRRVKDPAGLPTILYDEIDTVFGPRAKENEELRGFLNAGHRRGAMAGRCVPKGKVIVTEDFPAYCAVAMAGLGNLPDTILSRSVIARMRRRAPQEQVEPYRRRVHEPEGNRLRDRLATWAATVKTVLNLEPSMPDTITDRNADLWEALLSIADAAGGTWPARARVTAVTLVTDALGTKGSLGVTLLTDLQTIFKDREVMATTELIEQLINLEESPWGDLRGKPLDGRRLAKLLKPYGIGPKPVRRGGEVFKGYECADLQDAWSRYVPSPPMEPVTRVTSVMDKAAPVSAASATEDNQDEVIDED